MQSTERRRLCTEELPPVEFDSTKPAFERRKVLLALDGVITLKGSVFVQGSLVCSYEKTVTNCRQFSSSIIDWTSDGF